MRLFPRWDRWESASWITSTTGSFLPSRRTISQIRAPQPLRVPRTKGPFCQECAVPQPTNLIPGNSYRLSPNEGGSHARTCTGHSAAQRVSQTPPWQGESGLHCSSGPVEEPSVDGTGRASEHGLQLEGDLNRCLQLRLGGGAVRWQTGLLPLVEEGRLPSHQLCGNAGSMFGS